MRAELSPDVCGGLGLKIIYSNIPYEKQLEMALAKIAVFNKPFSETLKERLATMTFEPMDENWAPGDLNDHGFPCKPKNGTLEYLAHYLSSGGYYDSEIYNALKKESETNIAGFYLHEAANSLLQEGAKDIQRISSLRKQISELRDKGYYSWYSTIDRLREKIRSLNAGLVAKGIYYLSYWQKKENAKGENSIWAQKVVGYAFSDKDFFGDLDFPSFEEPLTQTNSLVHNYVEQKASREITIQVEITDGPMDCGNMPLVTNLFGHLKENLNFNFLWWANSKVQTVI